MKTSVTYLDFMFRILRGWNARISHRSISLHGLCTKAFRVFGVQYSCIELKLSLMPNFRGVDTSNMPIGYTGIHIQINASEFIMNLNFTWVLWI